MRFAGFSMVFERKLVNLHLEIKEKLLNQGDFGLSCEFEPGQILTAQAGWPRNALVQDVRVCVVFSSADLFLQVGTTAYMAPQARTACLRAG